MGNLIIGESATAEEIFNTNQRLNSFYAINQAAISRVNLSMQLDSNYRGKRDLCKILGYLSSPSYADYAQRYERQDITQRIINAYPEAIWSTKPTLTDDKEKEDDTGFEAAFKAFAKKSDLFHYIMRLDKLAGLGQYAVLYMGVRDGLPLDAPMGQINGPDGFLYYKPFSEANATIYKYDEDMFSPRYGKPLMYRVKTGGYGDKGGGSHMPLKVINVHHSRMLHVTEGNLENDVLGMPRLRPVIDRLMDLEKVVGGSSEIFWLNGRGGLSLNADKETDIRDPEKLAQHARDYTDQLDRILQTKGIDVKTLDMQVHDPDKHVAVILDLIASATGIPKRILIGSERGELASSQDEKNWWTRVIERRNNFCEPVILRPLIDRLIEATILPRPAKDDYSVTWAILGEASPTEKADIAVKKSKALYDYTTGQGADLIIPPKQFVEEILEMIYRKSDIDALIADDARQDREDMQYGDASATSEAGTGIGSGAAPKAAGASGA